MIGASRVDAPFLGGRLVPSPSIVLPMTTSASGDALLLATWPAGVPSGFAAWFQTFVVGASAVRGASATNGVQFTVP